MSVSTQLPAPRQNLTATGLRSLASDITSADIIVALGDYTGGATVSMYTLTAHGLVDGDVLFCVAQAAQGVVLGGPGTRGIVKKATADVFQLTTDGSTVLTSTADGIATFLKAGIGVSQDVADLIRANIFVCLNDYTGGTVEDMLVPYSGNIGDIALSDSIKLLFKSASGVAGVAADATAYVAAPVAAATAFYFQTSLTSGGAVADTTADGTAVWLKTS